MDDFYVISLPDYTVTVALTPEGRVIAERHYKHGSGTVSLGLPAGYLSRNEEPLEGAQRELLEETGYVSSQWRPLGRFVVDGNRGCGRAHFFLAEDCQPICSPGSGDLEDTELLFLTFGEMLTAVRSGVAMEICTPTALGLAHMELKGYE